MSELPSSRQAKLPRVVASIDTSSFSLQRAAAVVVNTGGLVREEIDTNIPGGGVQVNKERSLRRKIVRRQLIKTYRFLHEVEGTPPPSFEVAHERFETLLGLLVHPTVDAAMVRARQNLDLPDDAVVSLIGSSGNGVALLRTLAGTDLGLDRYQESRSHPDAETVLFISSPVSQENITTSSEGLEASLRKENIRSDTIFTIERKPVHVDILLDKLLDVAHVEDLHHVANAFSPGYPPLASRELREKILNQLKILGADDRHKHERVISMIRLLKEMDIKFHPVHLNNLVYGDQWDEINVAVGYLRGVVVGVFSDLLNATRAKRTTAG